MREDELREHALCSLCGKPIGASGIPLFWTAKLQHHAVDLAAVTRQQGLTMMLGGHAMLARVMGPDQEMTKPMTREVELTVCSPCANSIGGPRAVTFAHLVDLASQKDDLGQDEEADSGEG